MMLAVCLMDTYPYQHSGKLIFVKIAFFFPMFEIVSEQRCELAFGTAQTSVFSSHSIAKNSWPVHISFLHISL